MATDGLERRSPRHLRASDPAGRPAERGGATPPPEDEAEKRKRKKRKRKKREKKKVKEKEKGKN
jgi:hypothetical protein